LLHQPSKEGYLTKQGHFITNWKQRWFVVAGDILYYYRDPQDEIPAGVILLRGCMIRKKSGPGVPAFCFALEINETWLVDATSTSK
jgi:PH domain